MRFFFFFLFSGLWVCLNDVIINVEVRNTTV
ncbi:hypothetical protein [Bacillus phage BSTP10]|nr:hypothetical protein [Bacillus phage BSTP10]